MFKIIAQRIFQDRNLLSSWLFVINVLCLYPYVFNFAVQFQMSESSSTKNVLLITCLPTTLSRWLVSCRCFPTFHLTVWYWMAGLNPFVGAFFTQWVILMTNTLVGQVGFCIDLNIKGTCCDCSMFIVVYTLFWCKREPIMPFVLHLCFENIASDVNFLAEKIRHLTCQGKNANWLSYGYLQRDKVSLYIFIDYAIVDVFKHHHLTFVWQMK